MNPTGVIQALQACTAKANQDQDHAAQGQQPGQQLDQWQRRRDDVQHDRPAQLAAIPVGRLRHAYRAWRRAIRTSPTPTATTRAGPTSCSPTAASTSSRARSTCRPTGSWGPWRTARSSAPTATDPKHPPGQRGGRGSDDVPRAARFTTPDRRVPHGRATRPARRVGIVAKPESDRRPFTPQRRPHRGGSRRNSRHGPPVRG